MERNPNQKTSLKKTFSTQNLVMMAALIAIQIILTRFFSIQTDTLRISFGSIPLVLAGMWLGPLCGAIVAVIADVLGTLATGIISGISTKYVFRSPLAETRDTWKVALTVIITGILSSFVFGLVGSTLYSIIMKGNTTAFHILFWSNLLQRLATKPLTIAVDTVVVVVVNRAVYKPVVSHILSRA